MEEWKTDRKNISAGSFKWHADEFYSRGSNKPKHMYSPDWLAIETKAHQEKSRGGTMSIRINPLEGPPSPKPDFGFFPGTAEADGTLRPKSPTAMELGWSGLSGTQPLANTLNKKRPSTAMGTMSLGRSLDFSDSPKSPARPMTSLPGARLPRNQSLPEFRSAPSSPQGNRLLPPSSPFSRAKHEVTDMPIIARSISQPLHETAYAQPSSMRKKAREPPR
ncbi:unnamed protein product [Effrenium voratum]|uniref:Uncharacterized protein n=1 Tax=Effrenium voratum TaxID=2562239 RepID=A0AA36JFT0_9DINO|nr:unnamed protein product [Effrenium voratum]